MPHWRGSVVEGFKSQVKCVSDCCSRCAQDDAAAAGLRLPGPEDHGPGGPAEVSGSADRAAASHHRVSRRALVTERQAQDKEEQKELCHGLRWLVEKKNNSPA